VSLVTTKAPKDVFEPFDAIVLVLPRKSFNRPHEGGERGLAIAYEQGESTGLVRLRMRGSEGQAWMQRIV
jgi:hypothetical protein